MRCAAASLRETASSCLGAWHLSIFRKKRISAAHRGKIGIWIPTAQRKTRSIAHRNRQPPVAQLKGSITCSTT